MTRIRRETSIMTTNTLALILAACGGGGGGGGGAGGSNPPPPRIQSVSIAREGRVIDGPIVGAMVYVDANENGRIDDDDIALGETDEEGLFSGEVEQAHADKPLLADLEGAYDTDAPNVELSGIWRAPEKSIIVSPLTEFMVRGDYSQNELAVRTGLPTSWDATRFDPLSDILQTQLYIQQVQAAGRFAFEQLDGTNLPDIVELELDLHENHPRSKAIFYSGGDLALTADFKDNHLFEVRDNRLWFKESPDFESNGDVGNDNFYEVELTRLIDGSPVATRLSITINDIDLERSTSDPGSGVRPRLHQRSSYDEADLPSLAAMQLMSAVFWDSPDSGPLVLTWSIDDRDPSDELKAQWPSIFSDETKNAIENQAQVDAVRSLFQRAFTELEGIANIKFIEVDVNEATGQIGDLNIHVASGMERVTFGIGEFPSRDHSDIFLTSRIADTNWLDISSLDDFDFDFANFLRNGTLHEISHTLGLSHPFEPAHGWPGDENLRLSPDTFMSYRITLDHVVRGAKPVDVVALQWLYGPAGEDGMGAENLDVSIELV